MVCIKHLAYINKIRSWGRHQPGPSDLKLFVREGIYFYRDDDGNFIIMNVEVYV